jgi:hypothetical protein
MARPKITFTLNVPVVVVLLFPDGRPVESRFEDQLYYSVVDDAGEEMAMYVPTCVGPKIAALGLHKGDAIEITKKQTQIGTRKQVEWLVRRAIAAPAPPPEAWERETRNGHATAAAPARTSEPNGGTRAVTSPTIMPEPLLSMSASLRLALDACKEAEAYSREIGRPVAFDTADTRLLATTIFINANPSRKSW